MSNRGQMEIFGLVIIVILLAIGLLFAIIILTKTPVRDVQRVKESVMASNFLNTMMGTTSTCERRSVRQLLQDCALSGPEWVSAYTCKDGKKTCELAEEMIDSMLTQTLKKWGKEYKFFITGTDAVSKITIGGGECEGEREGASRPEKVRTGLDIIVSLQICQ